MTVTLTEFEKALTSLEQALAAPKTDLTRDATIQRFEFCVELSWKSAKKIMGSDTTAPKQVVREMAQNSLVQDIAFWLKAIDQRNLSSHTYRESLAEEVYAFAKEFLPVAQQLLATLKTL